MTLTDDPELVAARAVMAEESLVDAIAKALSKAPSLTRGARTDQRPAGRRIMTAQVRITLPSAATGLKSRHRQWESPFWWGDHLQRLP